MQGARRENDRRRTGRYVGGRASKRNAAVVVLRRRLVKYVEGRRSKRNAAAVVLRRP